jgi:hypothetical protein
MVRAGVVPQKALFHDDPSTNEERLLASRRSGERDNLASCALEPRVG